MRKLVIGIGAALALLVLLAILLPFIIDLNKYQDRYRPLIENVLNRKVMLTDIRLTILPRLGVRLAGFTVMDDPAFSSGAFASLNSLNVGVKLMPLLTGRVEIEELTLKEPVITVIKNHEGVLNLSTLGGKGAPPEAPGQPPAPAPPATEGPLRVLALLAVDDVSLTGGKLAYEDHSAKTPVEYRLQDLTVRLSSVRLGDTPRVQAETIVQPYNLPVRIDGTFGPLTEKLEMKTIDLALSVGKSDVAIKGSLIGGRFNATLISPMISSADLPLSLPLTKPVHVKDLSIAMEGLYPLKDGMSIEDAVNVNELTFTVALGGSRVNVNGTFIDGNIKINATSPSISSADVPVALPLTKPVFIRDLNMTGQAKYPFKPGAPPVELADIPALEFRISAGNSFIIIKGTSLQGDVKLTASSTGINSADLPLTLPLKKPFDMKDVRVTANMKGSGARLQNLALHLFGGQLFVQGGMTIGAKTPPFDANLIVEKMQLGPLLNVVSDSVAVSGTAGAQLLLKGQGLTMPDLTKSLAGKGRFAVRDGKIEGINLLQEAMALLKGVGVKVDTLQTTVFSIIEGELGINNGLVDVQRFLMDSYDFQATGKGSIGFDQTVHLKTNLVLSEKLSREIAGASPVAKLALSKGRLTVPMIISGTVQSPVYSLDSKVVGAKVTEQVKETVDELLKGSDGKGVDIEKGAEALKKLFGR